MSYTTADGTTFKLAKIESWQLDDGRPEVYLASLMEANATLPWESFNFTNMAELYSEIELFQRVNKKWDHMRQVLQIPLPATPTPMAIQVAKTHYRPHSNWQTFEYAGLIYRLPPANDSMFFPDGQLRVEHFINRFVYINNKRIDTIDESLMKLALRIFALQGFPAAPGLSQVFINTIPDWPVLWLEAEIGSQIDTFKVGKMEAKVKRMLRKSQAAGKPWGIDQRPPMGMSQVLQKSTGTQSTSSYDATKAISTEGNVIPPMPPTYLPINDKTKRDGNGPTQEASTSNAQARSLARIGANIDQRPPIRMSKVLQKLTGYQFTSSYDAAKAISTEGNRDGNGPTQETSTSNAQAHPLAHIGSEDLGRKHKRANRESTEEDDASPSSSRAQFPDPKRQKVATVDTLCGPERFVEYLERKHQLERAASRSAYQGSPEAQGGDSAKRL